jgi:cysteine desulfurase
VPGIVGLGAAAEICAAEMEDEAARLRTLRDRLLAGLRQSVGGLHVNGSMTARLPHNLNVSFDGIDGQRLLLGLTDVAVSSGAACTSATPEPPYVLMAMGVGEELARASIRFGLGRFNTAEEVGFVVARVAQVVESLRRHSSSFRPDRSVSPVEST